MGKRKTYIGVILILAPLIKWAAGRFGIEISDSQLNQILDAVLNGGAVVGTYAAATGPSIKQ